MWRRRRLGQEAEADVLPEVVVRLEGRVRLQQHVVDDRLVVHAVRGARRPPHALDALAPQEGSHLRPCRAAARRHATRSQV